MRCVFIIEIVNENVMKNVIAKLFIITAFLLTGAQIDAMHVSLDRALMKAIINNKKEIVKLLIAEGADVNFQTPDQYTPLHFAVHFASPEIVAMLLNAGANRAVTNRFGKTPLDLATERNNLMAIELLKRKD